MSFLSIWRKVFGTPIIYRIVELKKGHKYVWLIDNDNPEIIKAFHKQVQQSLKRGYALVPQYAVEINELAK